MANSSRPPSRWTSLHCYISPTLQSRFIANSLGHLIAERTTTPSFFFLRYWQGGPHVRVRFRDVSDGETSVSIKQVLEREAHRLDTGESRADYERAAEAQEFLAALEGEAPEPLRSHSIVEYATYVPERAKYGGQIGVSIAEDLFVGTSHFMARRLTDTRLDNSSVAEIYALELMLYSLRGFGLGIDDICAFSEYYAEGWLRYAPEEYRRSWTSRVGRVQERLRDRVKTILKEESHGPIAEIYANARARWEAHPSHSFGAEGEIALQQHGPRKLWYVLFNYIHTTNNRLGLMPAQEAFVGHLLATLLRVQDTGLGQR